jgi:alpha-aminoadipic semialdehyde synthase
MLPPTTSNATQLTTPIDMLASILANKLAYKTGERDTVLLHHALQVAQAGRESRVTASLLLTGTAHASAMATTVGYTLALAACRVLDGLVTERGVIGPVGKEVWEGVLDGLEERGVHVVEHWE